MDGTSSLEKIKKSLQNDNLCILPTDTIIGIFSSTKHSAVVKIFEAKKRDLTKPFAIFVPNIEAIGKYGIETDESQIFAKKYFPGEYTIILKATDFAKENLSPLLISSDSKIGIRIPKRDELLELTKEFIICGTSVNISGKSFIIDENIPDEIKDFIDLFFESTDSHYSDQATLRPSRILDFSGIIPVVVRQ